LFGLFGSTVNLIGLWVKNGQDYRCRFDRTTLNDSITAPTAAEIYQKINYQVNLSVTSANGHQLNRIVLNPWYDLRRFIFPREHQTTVLVVHLLDTAADALVRRSQPPLDGNSFNVLENYELAYEIVCATSLYQAYQLFKKGRPNFVTYDTFLAVGMRNYYTHFGPLSFQLDLLEFKDCNRDNQTFCFQLTDAPAQLDNNRIPAVQLLPGVGPYNPAVPRMQEFYPFYVIK